MRLSGVRTYEQGCHGQTVQGPVSWWSLRRNSRLKLMSSELEIVSGSLLGFLVMSRLKLKLKTRLRSEPVSVLAHHSSQAHIMTFYEYFSHCQ